MPAHVNTVRYRLKAITALTGRDSRQLRDACAFQIALVNARLQPGLDGARYRPAALRYGSAGPETTR